MKSLSPDELKSTIPAGLLSFPLTDFDVDHAFDAKAYRARLEWLIPHKAAALFAAGGTGEFFSLSPREFSAVIGTAVSACNGHTPIIAGAGYGTAMAIDYVREAERLGADGVLLLPHYLIEATQEGLRRHVSAVCKSTRLGVIVYNRANSKLGADTLARIADECPNLIGFKDGVGDIEALVAIRSKLGPRLEYLGGLPTAEVFAPAYRAAGVQTYSSAVFNFIPRTAQRFYRAVVEEDARTIDDLLARFFMPYLQIRNRQPGYAVSIVKAGARLTGRDAGPVRAPLTDLTDSECECLRSLLDRLAEFERADSPESRADRVSSAR